MMQEFSAFKQKVQKLYAVFQAHDAQQSDRLDKFRNIEPESAELLAVMIRAQQAQSILEIGTSTGYSTLWLAHAAKSTGAKVITLEVEADRSAQAKQHLTDFGLADDVDLRVGDALDFLSSSSQHFDFILLDAERDAYVEYWNHLPKLMQSSGGMLAVDNVISHATQVTDFIEKVQQDKRFISTTVPVGAGLFLVTAL